MGGSAFFGRLPSTCPRLLRPDSWPVTFGCGGFLVAKVKVTEEGAVTYRPCVSLGFREAPERSIMSCDNVLT